MLTRVRTLFEESIQAKIAAADALPEQIVKAAERLVECFVHDHKIIICGHGGSAANSLHFSSAMLHHFECERPGLPVINLSSDSTVLSGFGQEGHFEQAYARQIQALGQSGDWLMILCTAGQSMSLLNAVHAAHERGMDVLALTGQDGGMLANHLGPEDIELRVGGHSAAHVRDMHLFILHCFCDLIEHALFGQMMG